MAQRMDRNTKDYTIGDVVRLMTTDRAMDPNTYRFVSSQKGIASLECESTGKVIRVHESRLVGTFNKEFTPMSDAEMVKEAGAPAPVKKAVTKVTKAKADKPKRTRLDMKALLASAGEGAERWSKKTEFDHKDMDVKANIIIRSDRRAFVVFNTYDGSLGRKFSGDEVSFDTVGKVYALADDAAYEKKIGRIKTEGYTKHA